MGLRLIGAAMHRSAPGAAEYPDPEDETMALPRPLYGEVCGAAIVAVEQIIKTWNTDHGIVDEDD